MRSLDERIKAALNADEEELWNIVRDPHPDVISHAILNRNLTDEMATFIAKRKNVSSEVLGILAGDVRFKDSYKLKFAVCRNPLTPQRVTLSLLKFLRIFDLVEIAKDRQVNINIRRKVEYMIGERIPSMPLGIKTALARRADADILMALLGSGDEKVVSACLESTSLTEGHIYKLINRPATKGEIIRKIAEHEKWSLRYEIKYALIRNFHTPMARVAKFIGGMKTTDLKDLYADPKLPSATKPFIFRELDERGEGVDIQKEEIYDLEGDEDSHLSDKETTTE
jgi:hypothetical protein